MKTNNLAIFISGAGSNFINIFEYFLKKNDVNVVLLCSSKTDSPALLYAKKHNLSTIILDRPTFNSESDFSTILSQHKIDYIILAGFLWLIPSYLISLFPNKIINIHPSLLPKFGGKGMYGDFVHRAVKESNETQTGITIHFVNQQYDKGEIIAQYTCELLPTDTPNEIANKVHQLEYQHFPIEIHNVCSNF